MTKKLGFGSLSLFLVFAAFLWAFELSGFCFGDWVLTAMRIPAWSNGSLGGIHYTVFYAFVFLIPALVLALRFPTHRFAKIGKYLSASFAGLLLCSFFFLAI